MYQVCIVCSHRLIREALREIVRKSPAAVTGEGRNFLEASDRFDTDVIPDLLIFNLDLGSESESELAQVLDARNRFPSAKIIVLTDTERPEVAVRMVRAGVHALLSRDIPSDILQKTLHFVMLGQILLPAAMAKLIMEEAMVAVQDMGAVLPGHDTAALPRRDAETAAAPLAPAASSNFANQARPSHLSEREGQILRCLVSGFSNKAIARQLSLAEATVKVHIKSVLRKLQATNRTQAAVWALNNQQTLVRMPDDAPVGAGTAVPVRDLECSP